MFLVYQTPKTDQNKRNIAQVFSAFKFGAIIASALVVTSCSTTSQSVSLLEENKIVTGSVAKPTKSDGVEGTDAELIKTVVAENAKPKTSELAWNNPDTGNSGTIVAIDKFIGSHGQQCKKFQTTVDSFMGISLYDGETCEVKRGLWVLSWFARR